MKSKRTNNSNAPKRTSRPAQPGRKNQSAPAGANRQKGGGQNASPRPQPARTAGRPVMRGRIQGNAKGFGFFIPEDGGEDLFIPPKALKGAMHGDTVEAVVMSHHRGAGEAEVTAIVERGFKTVVGTFEQGNNCGFVLPDCGNMSRDVYVPAGKTLDAQNGEKVLVTLTDYPENKMPEGRVTERLGMPGEKGVDVLSVVRAHNLREQFPRKVAAQAAGVPQSVTEEQLAGRRDFRDELVITIDGDDSKDFDDALSVKRDEGGYTLGVHIADVAEYVPAGSALDKEAMARGTSVYLCDRVLPMLPVQLSNGICSLNEGTDRLTLSVVMRIDTEGNVRSHEICEGVIRSKARMTYTNTAAILDGDAQLRKTYRHVAPMLEILRELAEKRIALREKRGSIEFDLTESKIEIDPATGRVTGISKYPRLISHRIVEECMLLANETVAERFTRLDCPFVYRVHMAPPPEKAEALLDYLSALGIPFPGGQNPTPKDVSELLKTVDPAVKPAVSRVALRSMSKADYRPEDKGHFGLAAPYYCHFTSPIRRYPDLAIHRIIKDYLRHGARELGKYEQFVAEAARVSSEREREAEATEREVDDLKKAEYMSDKIGLEYDGTVSGATEWGLFVELDNSVEGLVRTETIPGGAEYIPAMLCVKTTGRLYRLGDPVRVVVDGVQNSKIAFKLV